MNIRQSRYAVFLSISLPFLAGILTVCSPCIAQEKEEAEEETFSISLVQTAGAGRVTYEVDGKKVVAESYSVVKGDHVWNLLRKRGLLDGRNLKQTLDVLKKLNSSLTNLDLIYPEDTLIIPLVISPIEGGAVPEKGSPVTVPLQDIKDLENYIVQPGDSLIKIVKKLYGVPDDVLYDEYLDQLRRINPSISDLNSILPGQKVRLPIYTPQVVRLPITPPEPQGIEAVRGKEDMTLIGRQLGEIFSLIGEGWLQTGEHYIPLKSGGQINLNAESYPMIDLRSGKRIIVDLHSDLPVNIDGLITSNWDNYAIVHLKGDEDLKEAIEKIIILCDYKKIQGANEPLILAGDIPVRITADWIIHLSDGQSAKVPDIVIVNLLRGENSATPVTIRNFLKKLGITTVDYPPGAQEMEGLTAAPEEVLEAGGDRASIIETILNLAGRAFSRNVEIPIYEEQNSDFKLSINADFTLDIGGRKSIIDLKGLGKDIISMLEDRKYQVLSLANEQSTSAIVTGTLEFLGIKYDPGPQPFLAANRDESTNIRLMIPGIIFQDSKGRDIFATHLTLSPEITSFLSQKGYMILHLPQI